MLVACPSSMYTMIPFYLNIVSTRVVLQKNSGIAIIYAINSPVGLGKSSSVITHDPLLFIVIILSHCTYQIPGNCIFIARIACHFIG